MSKDEERGQKMKSLLMKAKKELNEKRQQLQAKQAANAELQEQV